jgi:hypothetical protein
LFSALGGNYHFEELIIAYGRLHHFDLLLLSCLSMSGGFIIGAKLLAVIMRLSQNLSF